MERVCAAMMCCLHDYITSSSNVHHLRHAIHSTGGDAHVAADRYRIPGFARFNIRAVKMAEKLNLNMINIQIVFKLKMHNFI